MLDCPSAPLARHGRTAQQPPETVAPAGWDPSHIGFHDVLSAINPLQYLPVVGIIYREVTGDKVHPALSIAVSAVASLFLGPIGLAATMITVAATEVAEAKAPAASAPASLTAVQGPAGTAVLASRWSAALTAYQRAGRAA